ncbi:MAG: hypothetical protein RLZZ412_1498, partial [Verrucomicrobiota bacterium]
AAYAACAVAAAAAARAADAAVAAAGAAAYAAYAAYAARAAADLRAELLAAFLQFMGRACPPAQAPAPATVKRAQELVTTAAARTQVVKAAP